MCIVYFKLKVIVQLIVLFYASFRSEFRLQAGTLAIISILVLLVRIR
jgi:hypothetical protein